MVELSGYFRQKTLLWQNCYICRLEIFVFVSCVTQLSPWCKPSRYNGVLLCGFTYSDWGDWPSNGQTEIDAMIDAYRYDKQEDAVSANKSSNGLEVSASYFYVLRTFMRDCTFSVTC